MSYPSYPELKDSGVEWLGGIPKHWEATPVKFTVSKIGSGKTPKGGAEVYLNEGIVFLRSQNVYDSGLRLDDVVYIGEEVDEEMADTRVQPKDVLLNITGASIGRTCIIPQNFTRANVNQHVCIIRPKIVAPEFLSYFLKSDAVKDQIRASENGSSREGLNFEQVGNLLLVFPEGNESEQQAIAAFLDRKTAELDELIRLKERQIELLGAKRQALISHAVTRGLDPSVKMRPSGIEWLGEIPAHWEVAPVYARYLVQLGKMLDSNRITGEHLAPYLRNVDVQWDYVNVSDLPQMDFSPSDRERFELQIGDLLVCEGGEVGRTAIWRGELGECYYQKAIHRLRPIRPTEVPRFFFHTLRNAAYLGLFVAEGNPNTIDHLTAEKLRKHKFAFPPFDEQQDIVIYLDGEISRIDEIVQAIQTQIDHLREYRQALISAAVTGKIDVRGVAHVVRDDALKR